MYLKRSLQCIVLSIGLSFTTLAIGAVPLLADIGIPAIFSHCDAAKLYSCGSWPDNECGGARCVSSTVGGFCELGGVTCWTYTCTGVCANNQNVSCSDALNRYCS